MKICIIGGTGVMGSVLLEALIKWDSKAEITVTGREATKLAELKKKFNQIITDTDNAQAVAGADLILLAVKPQNFEEVAGQIRNHLDNQLAVSIMAGIGIKKIESTLGVGRIVRAMPNLGARVGKSMTVWTGQNLFENENAMIKQIFGIIGEELYVKGDSEINKATAVSGSGPGFFFYFVEEWIKAAQGLGFSAEEAKKMILKTLDGANTILQDDPDPEKLKKQVASKGGTTEAGLKALEDGNLADSLKQALVAARTRAEELAKA